MKRVTVLMAIAFASFCFPSCMQQDSMEIEPAIQATDVSSMKSVQSAHAMVPFEILIQFDYGDQLNSDRDVYVMDMRTGLTTPTKPSSTAFYTDGAGNKFNWAGDINQSNFSYMFNLDHNDQGEFLVYTRDNLGNPSFKNAIELHFYSSNAPDVRIAYKPNSVGFQFSGGNHPESLDVFYRHYNPNTLESVSISNHPYSVTCPDKGGSDLKTWTASSTGGSGNVAYTWYRVNSNGSQSYLGSGISYSKTFGYYTGSPYIFKLKVVATDATSSVSATKNINVFPSETGGNMLF